MDEGSGRIVGKWEVGQKAVNFPFAGNSLQGSNSDFNDLLGLRTMVKRFRSVLLPHEIDLNGCSDAIKLILFGEMHHSGPTAFFARIADHSEFGPVAHRAHSAHVDLCDFPSERVKCQASRLNVLPPLIGTEHSVSGLDSKVLCGSRSSLNLLNKAVVFLELVNDSHRVSLDSSFLEVIDYDSRSGGQFRLFRRCFC